MTDSEPEPKTLRLRGQWRVPLVVVVLVLLTFANALANVLAPLPPSAAALRHVEEQSLIDARRMRIVQLLADGDGCHPSIAHELARALVFDGRSARAYGEDYERRCGLDPVIRHWADAPIPHRRGRKQ